MKSWSNLKINDSFRIYSSWAFWKTPNMSDLSDYWMRYSKFKYNQIFASDFSQRLSSCVLNMPSNENLKASICSLVTPLLSHVIKFIVHSIILIWQAMFSCPAWFWLYCIIILLFWLINWMEMMDDLIWLILWSITYQDSINGVDWKLSSSAPALNSVRKGAELTL